MALIFGITLACRRKELCNLKFKEDKATLLLVKIPHTKNYKPRSFVVGDKFYHFYKKYDALRSQNMKNSSLFLNNSNEKCTQPVIEINECRN